VQSLTRTSGAVTIERTVARVDTDLRRLGEATTVVAAPAVLDYYLIFPETGRTEPAGIVVEEFVLADDYSTVGLNSAGWTPADGNWWSSAAFSRRMRTDPALRARVVAADRHDAVAVYRRLGAGELPDETTLRTEFHEYASLDNSKPLWLSPAQVPAGFHDKRVYRLLFANKLDPDRLASLRARWQMTLADDLADPQVRVLGTAQLRVAGDSFSWELRRIGADVAWCLDLTAYLGSACADAIGPLLRELRTVMRQQGLIPVTVERFS
jgi:hypothetical protein